MLVCFYHFATSFQTVRNSHHHHFVFAFARNYGRLLLSSFSDFTHCTVFMYLFPIVRKTHLLVTTSFHYSILHQLQLVNHFPLKLPFGLFSCYINSAVDAFTSASRMTNYVPLLHFPTILANQLLSAYSQQQLLRYTHTIKDTYDTRYIR